MIARPELLPVNPKRKNGDPKNTPAAVTVSPALDWVAAFVTHIPDKGQQLLPFYGHYSNVCQGRKRRASGRAVQPVDEQAQGEDDLFRKQCRSDWARLIKKILEVDPLVCPKSHGPMTIISFLEDPAVVKRILVHLNLWEIPERSPPPASPPRDSPTIRTSSVGSSTNTRLRLSHHALRFAAEPAAWAEPAFSRTINGCSTRSLRLSPARYAATTLSNPRFLAFRWLPVEFSVEIPRHPALSPTILLKQIPIDSQSKAASAPTPTSKRCKPKRAERTPLEDLGSQRVHKTIKFCIMAGTAMSRSHRDTGVSPLNDWAV